MLNISYGRQEITKEDLDAVISTLQSDWLTQGPAVAAFEKEFAVYVGAQYAVAVSNGTTALHIAAQAMNVKDGSRVITTPITFVASANCIRYCGGEPVFADIDEKTMLLDLNEVRKLLEANPPGTFEGIIPVSFAGYPADMEAFRNLADEHGLWLIEDACHAPGASFTDSKGQTQLTGNSVFADLSIFSFHPVKHITTGEGGMITTNNKELYQKLMSLRSHGITRDPNKTVEYHGPWYYEMQELGYNYRIADMACALGSSQLKRAKPGVERRQAIAQIYTAAFQELPLQVPFVSTDVAHAYHLYIIQTPERKALYEYLKEQGIGCQVHYVPVHTMPYYQTRGWEKGDFPKAEAYYEQCLSLPMYPSLSDNDITQIINHIKNFFYAETSDNSSPGWEQKNRT